jgi:hypothetical protein
MIELQLFKRFESGLLIVGKNHRDVLTQGLAQLDLKLIFGLSLKLSSNKRDDN